MAIWMIRVAGYGTWEFEGTEEEAEERRRAKCQHERGVAMKWRKDLSRLSDQLGAQIASFFDQGDGVSSELIRARAKALKEERA